MPAKPFPILSDNPLGPIPIDADPLETSEWIDSLRSVVAAARPARGQFLVEWLLAYAHELGDDVVAGLCAWAEPAGPLSGAGYESLREALLKALVAAGSVNFVSLVLHGAMPKTAMQRVPMPGLFGTTEAPMAGFVRRLRSSEKTPGIRSVSALHGFPWSDSVHTGASILVVRAGDDPVADGRATASIDELSREFFALRLQVPNKRMPLTQALDAAVAWVPSAGGLVVLADAADNPGGGAACDSTHTLKAVIDRGLEGVALGMIWDPQAALIASDAGVGARLALRIGGKVGPMSGLPVDAVVDVLAVRRDAHQRGLDGKVSDPLGLSVAVRAAGIDIVINSIRQQVFSPDCFTQLGIDLSAKSLVDVKSTQQFRAGFDPIAATAIHCDTPGTLNGELTRRPCQSLRRPVWPLDEFASVGSDARCGV